MDDLTEELVRKDVLKRSGSEYDISSVMARSESEKIMKEVSRTYTTINLSKAIKSFHEIMFGCDSYYIMQLAYADDHWDYLRTEIWG